MSAKHAKNNVNANANVNNESTKVGYKMYDFNSKTNAPTRETSAPVMSGVTATIVSLAVAGALIFGATQVPSVPTAATNDPVVVTEQASTETTHKTETKKAET